MLTTKKARAYKPALQPMDNVDFERGGKPIYMFNPLRITIQHNKVYKGAIAILIDGKVISLKDSFTALTDAVSRVQYNSKVDDKVLRLYDELSGKDENEDFWVNS